MKTRRYPRVRSLYWKVTTVTHYARRHQSLPQRVLNYLKRKFSQH